jgi:hypothetical protein
MFLVPYIICSFAILYVGGHQRLFNEAQVHPSVALELPEGTLLEVIV